ncbi:neurotrimin-like isoform X1 [Vanessa tameamea]|uniref:Neurotrimin-like isoform X1 n=1 Tax=Vanessa tameamea TaxID=334116 RepID=A0A8B8HKW6_VANTA|nr:neurotrimin-like isoform X1 [Vanessa tameamea]XP_047531646.1 neurotrimin-like isoform X1 [Vanessa atalanta]
MTLFIHLYCVVWIMLLTVYCSTTGQGLPNGLNVVSVAPIEVPNESMYPRFAEPIPNVTVTVGRDALLACVVDNLRGFKVAWVRMDTQTILSIHHNIITQNPRISLSYNDHRSWYLHIKNVQEVDRGWYMCQVNTDPMRSRKGYLQVVVPPSIIDNMTSTDMVVREGTDVTLVCQASGYPEPYVMWRREDGQDFNYNGDSVGVVDGETLTITKVSRLHMGAYLCIASNGVPPSISKRIMLMVQFPPMLSIPNQLEGAYIGQDVTLECHTEAFPSSINYWTTDRGDMIISEMEIVGGKYEAFPVDSGYNKFMMLKIRNITKEDFGSYKCIAKNSLGETDGIIKLDEIPAPPSAFTTTQKSILDNQTIRKKGQPQIVQTNDAVSSTFQGVAFGEQIRDFDFYEEENIATEPKLGKLLYALLLYHLINVTLQLRS